MTEPTAHAGLTPAERGVLLRTIEGASTQDIALMRAVSVHTIRTQIASIHRKLDVPTTTQAVVWGITHRECCLVRPWERRTDDAVRDDAP